MALTPSTMVPLGTTAPDFALLDTHGRVVQRDDLAGAPALVVMFLCNHCPYVRHVRAGLAEIGRDLAARGVAVVGICSNDAQAYPADAPDRMAAEARDAGWTFPYLHDATQQVARAYGAACTPDFFGFNAGLELQYRGRLDASGRNPAPPDARRELLEAMIAIARTGKGPADQTPSMGCSIKWRRG